MASESTIITSAGRAEIEERVRYLKEVRRQEIADEIKEARGFGDLSENAEYDEAKNEQARIEAEIANLEKTLRIAHVVDETDVDTQRVNVGTYVRILDKETDEEERYQIVGSAEADLSKGKISNESPVGAALLGKKTGQTVRVETPGGIVRYKILEIHR